MCISTPKAPEAPKASPPPAPAPVPVPEEVAPQSAESSRTSRLKRLRAGLASTIKTSPKGVLGTGEDLYSSMGGKTQLGA